MSETKYLALLRGINVGGHNIIKMADLKSCFEEMEFADVVTYIQSGNVIFGSSEKNETTLTSKIERGLSARLRYNSRVLIVSHKQLRSAVQDAPTGFGSDPARYRYDVIFLMKPLAANKAMESITVKEGVDKAYEGRGHSLFLTTHSKGITKPVDKSDLTSNLSKHDDSKLEHNDETVCLDGKPNGKVKAFHF